MVLTKRQELYMSLLLFLYLYICRSFMIFSISAARTSVLRLNFVTFWRLITCLICISFETINMWDFLCLIWMLNFNMQSGDHVLMTVFENVEEDKMNLLRVTHKPRLAAESSLMTRWMTCFTGKQTF